MDKFEIIKNEIDTQIGRSEVDIDQIHSRLTWKWALRLKPDADIPFQIAALGHDYERSFPERERSEFHKTYDDYKQAHAKKSAIMIASLMEKNKFSADEIARTKILIENHEIGGEGDLQLLCDADSLAFFEGNIPYYEKTHTDKYTKKKIIFIYKRISNQAKDFLKQISYEDKKLEKLIFDTIENIQL